MPIRRRKAFGRRRNVNGKASSRKRTRPMDFDDQQSIQIASPHEGELHIENEVNPEPAIKKMFLWCYSKLPNVREGISFVVSVFSPSNSIQARIASTQAELDLTKQELKRLSEKLDVLESKMKHFSSQKQQQNIQVIQAPPAPPPPPPPPPPPLPTIRAPKITSVLKKSSIPASSSNGVAKKKEATSKQTLRICLDDILKVKLKKRPMKADKENEIPSSQSQMKQLRVTLSDITSMSLRSLQENKKDLVDDGTPKSVLLRRTLRPTTMKRSPGGTPIVNRNHTCSTATGPTPEIERALRRKFRSIRTSPLAEDNSLQSPPTSDISY